MFMDLTGWPKWVRKYKVQPGTHEPIDRKRLFAVNIHLNYANL